MKNSIWVPTMTALPNSSFAPAHVVLRKMALRTVLSVSGLWRMVVWGFLVGGGCFFFVGMGIDALLGNDQGSSFWNLFAWVVYMFIASFFFFHSRGPVVIVGTQYFSTRRFDRSVIVAHGLSLFAMLIWSQSFFWTVVLEAMWIVFWVALLLGRMWLSTKPMSLSLWFVGSVCVCNERDMVLDAIRSWDWWDGLSNRDKKVLWDALPDWKWQLHAYTMQQQDEDLSERIVHWMELETHPYWNVARTMNAHDIAASIRIFCQARDGVSPGETYALPL